MALSPGLSLSKTDTAPGSPAPGVNATLPSTTENSDATLTEFPPITVLAETIRLRTGASLRSGSTSFATTSKVNEAFSASVTPASAFATGASLTPATAKVKLRETGASAPDWALKVTVKVAVSSPSSASKAARSNEISPVAALKPISARSSVSLKPAGSPVAVTVPELAMYLTAASVLSGSLIVTWSAMRKRSIVAALVSLTVARSAAVIVAGSLAPVMLTVMVAVSVAPYSSRI